MLDVEVSRHFLDGSWDVSKTDGLAAAQLLPRLDSTRDITYEADRQGHDFFARDRRVASNIETTFRPQFTTGSRVTRTIKNRVCTFRDYPWR